MKFNKFLHETSKSGQLNFAAVAMFASFLLSCAGVALSRADESGQRVVVIKGTTGKIWKLTVDEMKQLPRVEIETTDRKGQKVKYSGVAVSTLLTKVDTALGEKLRGEWLGAFVTVDALDEYRAVFALPEFDADFTDRVIILADERDGKPLEAGAGPFQIIVPDEKRHARWVKMVKEIRVLDSRWFKEENEGALPK